MLAQMVAIWHSPRMATHSARVVAYTTPALADLLAETAALLGLSRSQLASEMLTASTPVLEALRDTALNLDTLRKAPPGVARDVAAAIAPLITATQKARDDLALIDGPPLTNRGVTP